MLGTDILVAPVVEKGQTIKTVHLPEGTWVDADGTEYAGGQTLPYPVTIASLPYFQRKK